MASSLLQELSSVMTAATGISHIYFDTLPDKPDTAIALVPGPSPQAAGATGSPTFYRRPRVSVMCRSARGGTAYLLAETIYQYVVGVVDEGVNGTRYLKIESVGEPAFTGKDSNRTVVAFTIECWKDSSSLS